MVKRLKKRFMLISLLSVFAALIVLVASMNIINYRKLVSDSDRILVADTTADYTLPEEYDDVLEDSSIITGISSITVSDGSSFNISGGNDQLFVFMGSNKIFSAHIDPDMNMTTLRSTLFGYSESQYEEYAVKAVKSGKERGFVDDFRFKVKPDPDGGYEVVCCNVSESLNNFRNFLEISIGVSVAGILVLAVILFFVSDKAIRPIVESYEKQKRFITDAGHELKTPLTIIRADADALEMDIGDGNEWVSDIRKQTIRMNELTNNLILLSKMEETHLTRAVETVQLHDVVEEQSRSFKAVAESCGVDMNVDVTDTIVKGDTKMLTQLVSILMDNAVKYCLDHKSIDIKLMHDQKNAILEITNDTKEDIKEESIKHLFDRFFRTDSSHNSETGGHGIGLSIARAIVDSHKGKITAEKRTDYSITFKVLLPLEQ